METKKANLKRRSFLLTLGAGGAGAAAALVAGSGTQQVLPPVAKVDAEKGQGYAESAHVRNYYRTTRT